MAGESQSPQFDSDLKGSQTVPSGVNVSEFMKHRMEEVVMLTEAIEESPFRGQAFQRLPKHMRRRQMSHYIKRLPRKLQRPYLLSLKDGPPSPTKRPSRKYRRRPSNLLLEYSRRQRKSVWLETHIWHAKRFHMTTRWGYKLPEKPVNKSFKACYRAITKHCLLMDMSYYNCIELKGPNEDLLKGLQQCTSSDCGLTFAAKTYEKGTREGHVTLFHPNKYPYGVIGNVSFIKEPEGERIWIWVHPLIHDEVSECFKSLFELSEVINDPGITSTRSYRTFACQNGKITMSLLKDTLNRFRLTGPLSQAIVSQAFTPSTPGNWGQRYNREEWFDKKAYEMLAECCRPSDVPSGVILGLIVDDPRLGMPPKREKAVPKVEVGRQIPSTSITVKDSLSPIWIPEVRDKLTHTKLTTHEINQLKSKKIVPGFDAKDVIPERKQSKIPILLIQRPGKQTGHLGLGSGWDIIVPGGFGMPIWLSLIFRGARTGGLREFELLQVETTDFNEFPSPDSNAAVTEYNRQCQISKEKYFKLPPDKRPNFTKLGVGSPFSPLWKVLVKDWISISNFQTENSTNDSFYVLKHVKLLREISEIVKTKKIPQDFTWGLNSLIPVIIECSSRGKPQNMALICIPNDEDFETTYGPVEPVHCDKNEKLRKVAKSEHKKLLKILKRKRRKTRETLKKEFSEKLPGKLKWKEILKSNSAPSESHSQKYKEKMEKLWLPDEVETIVDFCSRRLVGFVIKGNFSYSKSRGVALGFVTLPGLMEMLKVSKKSQPKPVVLVRNPNQLQYRFGELNIFLES